MPIKMHTSDRDSVKSFTSRVTAIYLCSLGMISILAVGGYYLSKTELNIQQTTSVLLNAIDHQQSLLTRTSFLAESLMTVGQTERNFYRHELAHTLQSLEKIHTSMVLEEQLRDLPGSLPQGLHRLYFELPTLLDQRMRRYNTELRVIVELPDAELSPNHPSMKILNETFNGLVNGLEQVSLQVHTQDDASLSRLGRLQVGRLVAMVTLLLGLGLFVFRPTVRRIQLEQKERLRAERLAVAGTVAAQVAHEIRNPLGSITLNLDLVDKEITQLATTSRHAPNESRILVNDIREESRRIQAVIEEYLAFARPPKLNRRPLELNQLLDHKLAFMNPTFENAGIKVRREFNLDLPQIQADAEQLWQAVLNLLRNAIDAMPNGGTLTVATERNGTQAVVRVTDTGSGLTAEESAKVVQPFYSTKVDGTGLGLTLVQQIVVEHGGHLEFNSKPGQGSTFTISLPLIKNK